MESWVGRTLGGFRIESEISRGGMSTVYRAFQPQLDRWVAVKVLRSEQERSQQAFLARFRREAKAVAALRHPNILTVFDYGEDEGQAYLVMEYIAAGALSQLLDGRPLPWSKASGYILPVGRALAHAHSRKIIHCDVKPGNILLSRPDWPLLADFGLFKIFGAIEARDSLGLMSGTPAYASPEQLTGDPVGPRSDIYGLAIVLYELLTGKLPFGLSSGSGMMLQRLVEPPVPLSFHLDHVSPELEAILDRALAREPADRFENMEEFVRALSHVPGTPKPSAPLAAKRFTDTASTSALKEHRPASGPHLIATGTESMIPLPLQKEVVLGRKDPRASHQPDVDLNPHGGAEAGVSRRHSRLLYSARGWHLEDLNSTNGTSVNMSAIGPGARHPLHSGDVIRCGRLTLVFYEA